MLFQVFHDGTFELLDTFEDAAANTFSSEPTATARSAPLFALLLSVLSTAHQRDKTDLRGFGIHGPIDGAIVAEGKQFRAWLEPRLSVTILA